EALEKDPYSNKTEFVRIDMTRRFGYFSTESNGHLSEYVPWYRKRPDDLKNWICLDSWVCGETAGYLRSLRESRNWFEVDFPNWMKEKPREFGPEHRSREHGSFIIESIETGRTYKGWFNVVNNGCIPNLPSDAIIEVPGFVDGNGIRIPYVGDLPLGCAAVCNASISVQRLAVEAAIHGDDMLLRQAMMMDPLTGAVLNPPEIWQMVDELLVAQEQWLPQYKDAIEAAKKRLKDGPKVPIRNYKSQTRLKEKTVEEMASNAKKARDEAQKSDKTGQS
ncbi:MAG TPA: alpha-glucosidase/alpha-galactosidase, partial [Clostridia bacterium]|nr:alpha-glucosidase/alpha-galactosidase [Clostridia bacterium]